MEQKIVLVRPEHSTNIGAVCRAMATADLHNLCIVGKRSDYDDEIVCRLALSAQDIWHNARFYEPTIEGLHTAVSGACIIYGTTRRTGKKRTQYCMDAETCAVNIIEKQQHNAAVVFGNERTGLSDEELAVCSVAVYIPTSQQFGSLNLSHAVQVVCYELFKNAIKSKTAMLEEKQPATTRTVPAARAEALAKEIIEQLQNAGFFRLGGSTENRQLFNRILTRAALSPFEADHIQKLLEKIKGKEVKPEV